jgi:purine-binding chemotaxis protein CheW
MGRMGGSLAIRIPTLMVTAGSKTWAIPSAHVVETMRPLPIASIAGVPRFLLGLSVIRGAPVPVVDLEAVVGLGLTDTITRFVSLELGDRRIAVAVGAVIGIRELSQRESAS